ncbi:tyrosyl-DNA phosphodiesterase-domain-containing protein [Pisolithus marmoratus]|nr:tyrosyl-DNA phosphodiesterase-domain-containing protein [Pisolithus marmoratus]
MADQLFWDGDLRLITNLHCTPRQDDKPTFGLTEVLGPKSQITFAIISSFVVSVPWIYQFFEPRTPVILVAQPDSSGQASIKKILPNWVATLPFLRNGDGCQHTKFMLIFYETGRLRVVISTANLIAYEWGDIENAVWLQDIPPCLQPSNHDPKITDDFPSIMQRVLSAVNVRDVLTNMLTQHRNLPLQSIDDLHSKWDWSKIKVKLIPSIAGKHEGWPRVVQSGHPRLMKALRDLGLQTGTGRAAKELVIEYQGSSIGNYSTQWLNEFYYSARGESAEDWLCEAKARRFNLPWPPIKILLPECTHGQGRSTPFSVPIFFKASSSAASVKGNGKSNAEPITTSDQKTDREPEDNPAGVDATPARQRNLLDGRMLGHTISRRLLGEDYRDRGLIQFWTYDYNVNYELGILFPLYDEQEVERVSCFKRPPRKYDLGEDRPWIHEESTVSMEA